MMNTRDILRNNRIKDTVINMVPPQLNMAKHGYEKLIEGYRAKRKGSLGH